MVIVQNADSIPKGLISLFTAPLKHLMGNDKTLTLNFFANKYAARMTIFLVITTLGTLRRDSIIKLLHSVLLS